MKTLKDKYKFIKALSFLIIGSFIFLFENVHATNGISNLKISDDGVATWDEYGSNVIYNYVYKSYKGDTTVPYFNIKKYMDLREFDEGTYVFKVKAKNKDNIDLTSYESIKYTYTKTDTYEVSFFSNFGSPIPMQNVLQGQFAKRPQDPTRSGYTFDNWYIDNSCNTLFDFNEPISSDTIVYAKWNRNVDELRIYCDEIPIEKGPLPKFNATSSTQKVNIASYGNDTCWSKNTSMKQDGWFTLGNNPKVDDDTSHYGLRLKVETTDNHQKYLIRSYLFIIGSPLSCLVLFIFYYIVKIIFLFILKPVFALYASILVNILGNTSKYFTFLVCQIIIYVLNKISNEKEKRKQKQSFMEEVEIIND